MDLSTPYLKLFLGARSFESWETDLLADRMNVSHLLNKETKERYFLTRRNVKAMSFGNKILFGVRYYESLTEGQRLAVCAHEFGHILRGGGHLTKMRVVAPALTISLLLAIVSKAIMSSPLLLECAFAFGFLTAFSVLSRLNSKQFIAQELGCDMLAASFVDGKALISAIQTAESTRKGMGKRSFFPTRTTGHPMIQQRVDAIMAAMGRATTIH
jgi:Peptidase family M48